MIAAHGDDLRAGPALLTAVHTDLCHHRHAAMLVRLTLV
jgi:hypothetical protein